MATKCFCDRCDTVIKKSFNSNILKIKRHFEVSDQIWDEYQNYDLCDECLSKIEKYIRGE